MRYPRKTASGATALLAVLLLIAGCSAGDMVRAARIAAAGDVVAAERMAAEKAVRYAADPASLEKDVRRLREDFGSLMKAFVAAVGKIWGEKEVKTPRPKEYVKYTNNYMSRASVDFDRGVITVETLDPEHPLGSLKNGIVTTLLTPDDPRAVDLYTANAVRLGETPFLLGEVKDHQGKDIRWSWRAERFAEHLIEKRLSERQVLAGGKRKTVRFVAIPMIKDHLQVRARKYRADVEKNARRFKVSRNLVYAVIKTESDFNPYAVSSAPAFGLMQIVPETAGRDVNRLFNQKGAPTDSQLFDPGNNIRYGTAYLHLLNASYLDRIGHPVSREYCVIAAYNTGAGNVLRTFHKDRDRAVEQINRLSPLTVYRTLRERLPHDETRRYLGKVMAAKKEFVNF